MSSPEPGKAEPVKSESTVLNPLDFVTEEPPRRGSDRRFVVDAGRMYPAVVALLAAGAKCSTPDRAKYDPLLRRAKGMTQALADALLDCGEREEEQRQEVVVGGTQLADGSIAGGKREHRKVKVKVPVLPCEQLGQDPAGSDRLCGRAVVLETARKWFTNELHAAVAAGLGAGGEGLAKQSVSIEVVFAKADRWKLGLAGDVLEDLERRM